MFNLFFLILGVLVGIPLGIFLRAYISQYMSHFIISKLKSNVIGEPIEALDELLISKIAPHTQYIEQIVDIDSSILENFSFDVLFSKLEEKMFNR